jgi:thiol-disulfide isomerase/thioredoxin
MKTTPVLLTLALLFFLATLVGASLEGRAKESGGEQRLTLTTDSPVGRHLSSLGGATHWLNSEPLPASALRGKVVVVDFWTFSCINWIRTAPYVRAWAEKYKNEGLVVIGVHTPEFAFEKNVDRIRRAADARGVVYPIAVDSDYSIWKAFKNNAWPALYFIDSQGRIRHQQIGEGEYERSENVIKQLLAEAGGRGIDSDLVKVEARGAEANADWKNLKSPENYLGYARTNGFSSRGEIAEGASRDYSIPKTLRLNRWSLGGDWTVGKEAIVLNKANGRIAYRFHARDLHLVMGPAAGVAAVRFRVLIDGQPPGAAHGIDVDALGNGTMTEHRLHQLIRQPGTVGSRQFEIEFLDRGVEAYAFTFG